MRFSNNWAAKLGTMIALLVLGVTAQAATTLKIATLSPEGTGWMIELRQAAKSIRERTNDQVKLKIYPGGVMGDDKAVLRKLRVGQLHGAAMTSGGVMQPYPDIALYNLPLVFRDSSEVDYVRARLDEKLMAGLREQKFVGFGLAEVGFAYPMMKDAVTSVASFQDRRVWAPDNDPGALKAYSSFNITPIPLPIADVLTGLQTGLIDSIGSPPIGAIALQWHTQVDYALELPLMYVYGLFAITERALVAWTRASKPLSRKSSAPQLPELMQRRERTTKQRIKRWSIKVCNGCSPQTQNAPNGTVLPMERTND